LFVNIVFMILICPPKVTIDVAPCFVLPANRSLVDILHNNVLRHSEWSHTRSGALHCEGQEGGDDSMFF
jgi:hypothetical protein